MFAGTFLAQAGVAAISAFVLLGVRLPTPRAKEAARGRPLKVIVRQFRFVTAVVCGMVSYLLMNFLMTSAPLARLPVRLISTRMSNLGWQWHVIAMYGPDFFTGRLITRFGAARVVAVGLTLLGAAAAVGLAALQVKYFWSSLIQRGLGRNFGFLGASAMALESSHLPAERTKVQSLNDFIVFGTMAVGSFSSGGLLTNYGWSAVLWVSFIPLLIAVCALAASVFRALSTIVLPEL